MKLTCGVVVYDEIKELQRLIPQLLGELLDYQVDWIFVLNHEQQEIRQWIKSWLVEHIKNDLTCFENPSNNLGFARQIVLTHSRNELVYLTDPDIDIEPGAVVQLIELSQQPTEILSPSPIMGYGGTLRHLSKNRFLNDTFEFMSQVSKFFPFAFQIQTHRELAAVDHLPACHLLLKKSIALKIGGFSYLQPRNGEDTDFTHRAYNEGYLFLFLPRSEVRHWQNQSIAQWYLKIFGFGRVQISVQRRNFQAGLRLYRLLPLCFLLLLGVTLFLWPATAAGATLLGLFIYFTRPGALGFFLILFCYSLGEWTELVSPFFESKDEVQQPELKPSPIFQSFAGLPEKSADFEI